MCANRSRIGDCDRWVHVAESLWGFREDSRRIGRRMPVRGSATITIPAGRRKKKTKKVPVEISNLSVTGLGFFADHSVLLSTGQIVMFEVEGASSLVRVRRSADIDHGRLTYYGVQFTESSPAVMPILHERLGEPAR
jgi:hypothetical protein